VTPMHISFVTRKKQISTTRLLAAWYGRKHWRRKKERETQANARTPAPAQEQNLQAQNQNISPRVPGPAPLGQAKNVAKSKAAPSPAPAAEAASGYAASAATETVMVSDSRLIAAPGSAFVWRPGRAGLIEFSPDGGRSWMRQRAASSWTC